MKPERRSKNSGKKKSNDAYAKVYYNIPTPKSRRRSTKATASSQSTLSELDLEDKASNEVLATDVAEQLATDEAILASVLTDEISPTATVEGIGASAVIVSEKVSHPTDAKTNPTNNTPPAQNQCANKVTPSPAPAGLFDLQEDYNHDDLFTAASALEGLSQIDPAEAGFDITSVGTTVCDDCQDADILPHSKNAQSLSRAQQSLSAIGDTTHDNDFAAGVVYNSTAATLVVRNNLPPPPPSIEYDDELAQFLASTSTDELSIEDTIRNANIRIREDELASEEAKYSDATAHSGRHEHFRQTIYREIVQLIADNKALFGPLADMQPGHDGNVRPKLIFALAGKVTMNKATMCSNLLWKYSLSLKNSQAAVGGCPYLQPSTHMSKIRNLLGMMRSEFDWEFELDKHFKFRGGFEGRIKQLFEERASEYPSIFGTGTRKQIAHGIESSADIDLSVFNEHILEEHQQKCLVIFGITWGFRGRQEHAHLHVSQVVVTTIMEPHHSYHGYTCVEVRDLLDKSTKLTMRNVYKRDGKYLRYPIIDMNDPNDNIACIVRYMNKFSPGQERFYCQAASDKKRESFVSAGFPHAAMSPRQPLGENTIARMIANATKKCGLGDVKGQGLRRIFITTLANSSGVSEQERLSSARHSSVAAQLTYQTRDTTSEAAKFESVGMKKKDDEDDKDKKKE